MSKSSKPILLYFLLLMLSVAGIIISVVIIKISYEQMLMTKDRIEKELIIAAQEQEKLTAIYQDLTSEDLIVPFAEKNLMLVRNFNSFAEIKISNKLINQIEELIKSKYE